MHLQKKGSKHIHIVAKKHGENITIVASSNGTRYVIPHLVLFSVVRKNPGGKKVHLSLQVVCSFVLSKLFVHLSLQGLRPKTTKVWMNTETFVEFLRHVARFKPSGLCLLIFDGSKSHLDYSIREFSLSTQKHYA